MTHARERIARFPAVLPAALVTLAVLALAGTARAQHGAGAPGSGFEHREWAPPPGGPPDGFDGPMGGPPPPRRGPRPPSREDLERAGVAPAVRAKIAALHDDALRRAIRVRANLAIADLDVRRLIESERPDTSAVDAALDRVGALRLALHKLEVHEMIAMHALLTPDQRAKLRALRVPERR